MTRHLKEELSAEDWDMMTLHYLGLDHIGHMYGPTSNLVAPKLLEMDAVVHQIYTAMNSWVNLKFCVCVFVYDTCECVSLHFCGFVFVSTGGLVLFQNCKIETPLLITEANKFLILCKMIPTNMDPRKTCRESEQTYFSPLP